MHYAITLMIDPVAKRGCPAGGFLDQSAGIDNGPRCN
jgi:hypothetical protein